VVGATTPIDAVVSPVDQDVSVVLVPPLVCDATTDRVWFDPGTQLTTAGVDVGVPSIVTVRPEGEVAMVFTEVAVALGAVNRIALLFARTAAS
jgi:hypothetical protein